MHQKIPWQERTCPSAEPLFYRFSLQRRLPKVCFSPFLHGLFFTPYFCKTTVKSKNLCSIFNWNFSLNLYIWAQTRKTFLHNNCQTWPFPLRHNNTSVHCGAQHPMSNCFSILLLSLDEHALIYDTVTEIIALTQNLITSPFDFFVFWLPLLF